MRHRGVAAAVVALMAVGCGRSPLVDPPPPSLPTLGTAHDGADMVRARGDLATWPDAPPDLATTELSTADLATTAPPDMTAPPDLAPATVACPASPGLPPIATTFHPLDGGFCDGAWCWENPLPFGYTLGAVWSDGGVTWLAAGNRWIGFAGSQWHIDPAAAANSITVLAGDRRDDLYACANKELWHYDGGAWSRAFTFHDECRSLAAAAGSAWVVDIYGNVWRYSGGSAAIAWAAGSDHVRAIAVGPDGVWGSGDGGFILHGDGVNWQTERAPMAVTGVSNPALSLDHIHDDGDGTIWATASCDVTDVRRNGVWTQVGSATCGGSDDSTFAAIIGGGPLPAWVLGYYDDVSDGGWQTPLVRRLDGGGATSAMFSPGTASVANGWSNGSGAWLVAGDMLYAWTGVDFAPAIAGTRVIIPDTTYATIRGVTATADDVAWAAGGYAQVGPSPYDEKNGFLLRRDARGWQLAATANEPLTSVVAAGGYIWVRGYRRVYRWNGAALDDVTPWSDSEFTSGLAAGGADDVWVAGGALWHFDGSGFRAVWTPTASVMSLAAAGRGDAWAIAADYPTYTLAHVTPTGTTVVPLPADAGDVYAIHAAAPDDVWVTVRSNATFFVYRYDCSGWSRLELPVDGTGQAMWIIGVDGGGVWATGSDSYARFSGGAWQITPSPFRPASASAGQLYSSTGMSLLRRAE